MLTELNTEHQKKNNSVTLNLCSEFSWKYGTASGS